MFLQDSLSTTARRVAAATLVTAAAGGVTLLASGSAYASTSASFSYAGCKATLVVSGSDAYSTFQNTTTYTGSKGEISCTFVQERETSSSSGWSDASSAHTLGPDSSVTTYSYAVDYQTRDCITYAESGTSNGGTECGNSTS